LTAIGGAGDSQKRSARFIAGNKNFVASLLPIKLVGFNHPLSGESLGWPANMERHMTETEGRKPNDESSAGLPDPAQLVRETLAKLKFGAIQLTVHEGKLVQMEVTEKRRFA
jgi:hypothetical protein